MSLEDDFLSDFGHYSEEKSNNDLEHARSHCGVISACNVYKLASYQPLEQAKKILALEIADITSAIYESKSGRTKTLESMLEAKNKAYNRLFNDELPDGAVAWCYELACMRETGFCEESDVSFDNAATRWGKKYEPFAIEAIKSAFPFYEFEKTGNAQEFILLDGFELVGATPDAIVFDRATGKKIAVLDAKCPHNRVIHRHKYGKIQSYAQFKRDYPMYYWQGVLQMMCAKVNKFMFASFDPRQKPPNDLYVYEFDLIPEDADFLRSRIEKAEKLISEIMAGVK